MTARPRIKDVAEYAGVSPKTVSNVINDFEHVSERTRAAVREAIEALGYRVNLAGRQLRRGRTGMITLAVPELDIAYFAELAQRVTAEADRRGLTVLLHPTGGVRERELAALRGFDAQFSDGVVLSPLVLPEDLAGRDRRLPVVLLGERPADGGTDHVGIDNVRAAREATEHCWPGAAAGSPCWAARSGPAGHRQAAHRRPPGGAGRGRAAVRPGTGGAGRGVPLAGRRPGRGRGAAGAPAAGRAAVHERPARAGRAAGGARGRAVGAGRPRRGGVRRH
ncbi:HTH-type transcriptional repressor PurR [Streptomyces fumanus]